MVCLSGTLDPKGEKQPADSHNLYAAVLLKILTVENEDVEPFEPR